MSGFGRRIERPEEAATAAAADAPTPDDVLKRHGRVLVMVFLVAWAIFHPARLLVADRTTPPPRDLDPGRVFMAGAYVAAPGCPIRAWSVGDYQPLACLVGNQILGDDAPAFGLEAPLFIGRETGRRRNGDWSGYRQRYWVRAGDDALLLTGPGWASGKVVQVVPGRFVTLHQDKPVVAPDKTDYRTPPEDYRIGVRSSLWILPALLLAGAATLGLWMLHDTGFGRRYRAISSATVRASASSKSVTSE
jgi:hypothetical protein